jgi:hypothetical protein
MRNFLAGLILACRLLVDAGLVGGLSQGVFGLDQFPQPPEQAIGDCVGSA